MYYNPVDMTLDGIPIEEIDHFRFYYCAMYIGVYYVGENELRVCAENEFDGEIILSIAKQAIKLLPGKPKIVFNGVEQK